MILLNSTHIKSNNQVTQYLTVIQLSQNHCKHLIKTSEILSIMITIILTNIVVELYFKKQFNNLYGTVPTPNPKNHSILYLIYKIKIIIEGIFLSY